MRFGEQKRARSLQQRTGHDMQILIPAWRRLKGRNHQRSACFSVSAAGRAGRGCKIRPTKLVSSGGSVALWMNDFLLTLSNMRNNRTNFQDPCIGRE